MNKWGASFVLSSHAQDMVYSMSPDKYLKHKQGLVSLELLQTTSGVLTVGKALQAVQNHPEVELPFLHIQGHWLLMI